VEPLVADLGVEFRLPSVRFRRSVGTFAAGRFDPDGRPIADAEFRAREAEWLPSRPTRRTYGASWRIP
jgi:hypothetical protein